MIFVLESNGKGNNPADYVTLLTFDSLVDALTFIKSKEKRESDGHKYWTRFDIVEPGERIENYAE